MIRFLILLGLTIVTENLVAQETPASRFEWGAFAGPNFSFARQQETNGISLVDESNPSQIGFQGGGIVTYVSPSFGPGWYVAVNSGLGFVQNNTLSTVRQEVAQVPSVTYSRSTRDSWLDVPLTGNLIINPSSKVRFFIAYGFSFRVLLASSENGVSTYSHRTKVNGNNKLGIGIEFGHAFKKFALEFSSQSYSGSFSGAPLDTGTTTVFVPSYVLRSNVITLSWRTGFKRGSKEAQK